MKVLDRSTIIKHKMVDQIKREISIMKLVRHPHVVRLHEVLASRTKIYIILEFITGGELFDKIVHRGKLSEADSRRYFQQLIDGVDFCHTKGVYHRDLKPENLLLDSQGNLKISDFGLSALPDQGVSLLRTTCGTPNYVAPEVLSHKGYNGAIADIWSCGVILYVLLAGYLPFDEVDLTTLYSKRVPEQSRNEELGPLILNAFDLIILSQGLNLSALFDRKQDNVKHQTRFLSRKPAKVVLSSMEVVAQSMGFKTHIRNYKMRVEGLSADRTAHLYVMLQIFEVAPSLFMVEIQRAAGDVSEYLKFSKNFCSKLDEIIWKPPIEMSKSRTARKSRR
ncbi:CBL-interacting protein kinase 8 isoform X3 [Ananas comosus]|uniref:non-specific serine/threonine protein kinase n=1 Tax=Ananas comosus TaxID=4615 RepID=A0A6P5F440_ANACO|nr:CBL-interacting protein kinase 8 isoform X3 [Ananas comosus]